MGGSAQCSHTPDDSCSLVDFARHWLLCPLTVYEIRALCPFSVLHDILFLSFSLSLSLSFSFSLSLSFCLSHSRDLIPQAGEGGTGPHHLQALRKDHVSPCDFSRRARMSCCVTLSHYSCYLSSVAEWLTSFLYRVLDCLPLSALPLSGPFAVYIALDPSVMQYTHFFSIYVCPSIKRVISQCQNVKCQKCLSPCSFCFCARRIRVCVTSFQQSLSVLLLRTLIPQSCMR